MEWFCSKRGVQRTSSLPRLACRFKMLRYTTVPIIPKAIRTRKTSSSVHVAWRHGKARQDKARQGKARQGRARHCMASQAKPREDKALHGIAWQGKARQGKARQGKARQARARQARASQAKPREGKTSQGKARHCKMTQAKTRQGEARRDKARQGKTRQDRARQGKKRRVGERGANGGKGDYWNTSETTVENVTGIEHENVTYICTTREWLLHLHHETSSGVLMYPGDCGL